MHLYYSIYFSFYESTQFRQNYNFTNSFLLRKIFTYKNVLISFDVSN